MEVCSLRDSAEEEEEVGESTNDAVSTPTTTKRAGGTEAGRTSSSQMPYVHVLAGDSEDEDLKTSSGFSLRECAKVLDSAMCPPSYAYDELKGLVTTTTTKRPRRESGSTSVMVATGEKKKEEEDQGPAKKKPRKGATMMVTTEEIPPRVVAVHDDSEEEGTQDLTRLKNFHRAVEGKRRGSGGTGSVGRRLLMNRAREHGMGNEFLMSALGTDVEELNALAGKAKERMEERAFFANSNGGGEEGKKRTTLVREEMNELLYEMRRVKWGPNKGIRYWVDRGTKEFEAWAEEPRTFQTGRAKRLYMVLKKKPLEAVKYEKVKDGPNEDIAYWVDESGDFLAWAEQPRVFERVKRPTGMRPI